MGRLALRTTTRVLGEGGDAEDAAQEAILRAYRAVSSGTSPTHPEAWLTTIAKREAYRVHQRRRSAESLDDQSGRVHPALTTEDHSEKAISRMFACELLARADPEDQVLLLQRFLLDRTSAEISQALGMPDATVRVRLHRVLKHLRQIELQADQGRRAC